MMQRMLMMSLLAILATWVLMPAWIGCLKQAACYQPIREDGPESHHKKKGTPSMGGVLMYAVWILIAYMSDMAPSSLNRGLVYMSSAFFLLGMYDDVLKITRNNAYAFTARPKFLMQCAIAAATLLWIAYKGWAPTLWVQYLPGWGALVLPWWLGSMLWLWVVVGSSNAMNLLDGLDGLAAGVTLILLSGLWLCNQGVGAELNPLIVVLMGVVFAFIWYNHKPARIMMGDSGSLWLGSVLAYVAFASQQLWVFACMSMVLIATVLSVVIQVAYFKRTRQRWFKMAPLHHHFELSGLDESTVVMRYWMVSALCVLLGYVWYTIAY